MKRKYSYWKVIIHFICYLSLDCTFGSVGDRNLEELETLQNLIVLRDGLTVGLATSLQIFDNQADDNVSSIELSSGGNSYLIDVSEDSYIQWDTGFYRINPNEKLLGVFNVKDIEKSESLNDSTSVSKTHTPYTVPLDLPSTDKYGANYIFLNSGIENKITNFNSTNETGAAHTSSFTKKISDSPIGVISLATIGWTAMYLNINVTRSGVTKNAKILIGQGSIKINPKCKLKVDANRTKPINIGLQYSNLFRDYVENGTTISFLQNLFLKSGSEVIIAPITNVDLLNNITKNLNSEDLVLSFPSCTPGVER